MFSDYQSALKSPGGQVTFVRARMRDFVKLLKKGLDLF